jgi:tRNA A-37 threonylcarbamoyl transferase component Bud32
MFKKISIPSSFSFHRKGKIYLLIKDEYKDALLQERVEDLKNFLKRHHQGIRYLNGRTAHPSIPIKSGERVVLRQYSHGGLLRTFTRNLYLFGSRSFKELSLTEEIRSSGIPTIQPICAIHQLFVFPFYHAYLLSLEITHAINLIQYLKGIGSHPSRETLLLKRKTIRSIALLLQKFHREGFFHGDLQLKNILVSRDQVLLIDFDRSYRKPILSIREKMKNLLRLNRSAEKWRSLGLPITRTDCWRFFSTYAEEDQKIKETMKKALRTYPLRSFFYRFGWALEKLVKS